jgi:hypothetical protein
MRRPGPVICPSRLSSAAKIVDNTVCRGCTSGGTPLSRRLGYLALICIISLVTVACRREAPAPGVPQQNVETQTIVDPPVDLEGRKIENVIPLRHPLAERCEIGSRLGEQRTVAETTNEFRTGETIYLTMWLNESPPGLQAALVVKGPDGEEAGRLSRDVAGEKSVTFGFDRALKPGTYLLEGYWGANIACEEEIKIVAR